jgi:hypothetical protein
MLSSTGDAAGTANLRQVLRMPPASATSDMKPMYGNIQRVMITAESKPGSPLAMAQTSSGAPATPATHTTSSVQVSNVATWSISCRAPSSPSSALRAASTGTKAWLKAPSPKTRRNRLGMRNATLKASVSALTPKTEANSTSRTRPVIREARVSRETVEADLSRDTGAECRAREGAETGRFRRELGKGANPAYNGGLCCIILRHLRNIKYGIRQAQEEEPAPRLRP